MYAPVGNGLSNHQSSLLNSWWLHPPAGGAVGHGCDREGNSIVEGGSDRGGEEGHGIGPRGGIMDSHQQQFCLKWNSFGSNLATSFSNLFKSESLTDVILYCEGVQFKAHRLILAACSKHFQDMFEGIPPMSPSLIVVLDGTSAHNMAALLEFMYRGEVHVSQESLSSFLKAAECLQVKGLSIEHEKLAVAQRHATENNNLPAEASSNGPNGTAASSTSSSASSTSNNPGIVADSSGTPENGLARAIKRNRTPTPAPPSPAPTYSLPIVYSTAHYYDSPQKRLMRTKTGLKRSNSAHVSRSPSDVDSLGRASVLRDGAAFRPASAPHQLLLEGLMPYQSFGHPSEAPTHPHTAPHTPTELEQDIKHERSEEREHNSDTKEGVAEDLRIKQEPGLVNERERVDKLAERLSGEIYPGGPRIKFDPGSYANSTEQQQQQQQQAQQQQANSGGGPGVANTSHPPTPELSPAPTSPAMWNSKINKAGTVTTPDGKKLKCPFCERLYGYETNLRAHIRQRHQGIRVPCPFCARTFTRNNTVRRHIAREHKPELNLKALQQANNHTVTDSVQQ